MDQTKKVKGFTLLELLIVIAIIAILAAFLIFVLNPAEALRRSRDSQRFSDLTTLNKAIAFYITTVSNPTLDSVIDPIWGLHDWKRCEDSDIATPGPGKIWYSYAKSAADFSADFDFLTRPGDHPDPLGQWDNSGPIYWPVIVPTTTYRVDGSGWIPVKFTDISGGSPISKLPVDPVNGPNPNDPDANPLLLTNYDFLYRYTCKARSTSGSWKCGALTWEIDTNLESQEYQTKETNDGGDNQNLFEAGTCLYLLPPDPFTTYPPSF